MAGLSEHFRKSGYSFHSAALRTNRLPECCREGLAEIPAGVRSLSRDGESVILPLVKCRVCGALYAVRKEKFIPIDNPLKVEFCDPPKKDSSLSGQ